MNDRHRRCILFLMAFALAASLILKGRVVSPGGDAAAFLPSGSELQGMRTLRFSGDLDSAGVYQISNGAELETVMKMTLSPCGETKGRFKSGDFGGFTGAETIIVHGCNSQCIEITLEKMSIAEKIILGMPLDPNSMSESDWECIPGIGPVTAKRLVEYRQKYGGFSSLEELKMVPGLGDSRFERLTRYFRQDITP